MTIQQLQIKFKTLIKDTIDKPLMNRIGIEVAQLVKTRTRKGFGVSANLAPQKRLKGISESYKKQRKRLAAQGRLSGETTVNRSNLTKSGDMLDDITHTSTTNTATIFIKGSKNRGKAERGAKERPFMNLSKSEVNKITKIVTEEFNKDINKKGL